MTAEDGVVVPFVRRPENLIELEWVLEVLGNIPAVYRDAVDFWVNQHQPFDLTTDAGVARLLDYAHYAVGKVRTECDRIYRDLDEWRSERRQCAGHTKRGTRCRYLAPEGQDYCGEHRRMFDEGRLPRPAGEP